MSKAINELLKCTHPGRRWKRKYKRAIRVLRRRDPKTILFLHVETYDRPNLIVDTSTRKGNV